MNGIYWWVGSEKEEGGEVEGGSGGGRGTLNIPYEYTYMMVVGWSVVSGGGGGVEKPFGYTCTYVQYVE